jgi:hypothetical protein
MVELGRGMVTFKIEKRFGIADAERVRSTLEQIAPVREVVLDFTGATLVEDAALLVVANLMKSSPGCRFRLDGLTHHRRRMLAYMGVRELFRVRDAAGLPATAA